MLEIRSADGSATSCTFMSPPASQPASSGPCSVPLLCGRNGLNPGPDHLSAARGSSQEGLCSHSRTHAGTKSLRVEVGLSSSAVFPPLHRLTGEEPGAKGKSQADSSAAAPYGALLRQHKKTQMVKWLGRRTSRVSKTNLVFGFQAKIVLDGCCAAFWECLRKDKKNKRCDNVPARSSPMGVGATCLVYSGDMKFAL